ncbi:MAG TPA: glycerol-3-phosphate 1-O-acyltransferase PlsY [Acidimicrobiia bacterium]|nr:glycerol-3-phosphate 1-O-acyltransferase PlsY [Acidimicrobiia bacterium]
MPSAITILLALLAAYVVGSLDFAVVVGRMHGVDIHEVGSGNPGTANVLRTLGRGPAAMVFVGDMLKGVIAAAIGMVVGGGDPQGLWAFAAGLAAVVGHCYPVFHRFRGGKGVATAVGVVLFTLPWAGMALAAIWIAVVAASRVSAVGSLALAAASVPAAMWRGLTGVPLILVALTFLLVVWRHRSNIRRLVTGDERPVTNR